MQPPEPINISTNFISEKSQLAESEFRKISSYVTANYGIKLPVEKRVMVESRLQKRLRATGIQTFREYVDFVMSEKGQNEMLAMIDVISTNKTDFFRESSHFDYLRDFVLPEWQENQGSKTLKIWSSASSSGEESYTIAITIEEYNRTSGKPPINYSIFGTDISYGILKKAVSAIYTVDRIKDIPVDIRNRYFLRSKDRDNATVRVIPRLRSKCKFGRLNLMDASYNIPDMYDVIFCRNVLIYFDPLNQERVINKLCDNLTKDGYFFLGHSESILGKNVPLKQIKPTIYKRKVG